MSTEFGTNFAMGGKTYRFSIFKKNSEAFETREVWDEFNRPYINEVAQYISEYPWAPGIFAGKIRNNKTLESIQLLVLDVDEGCTLEQAKKIFAPLKHIIGTSKSHRAEKNGIVCDRFRVILFLPEAVTTDEEFKAYWFAAFDKWPFIDKACKDSARFFFPCTEIVSVNESGIEFTEIKVQQPVVDKSKPNIGNNQKGRLSQATKDFIAFGAPSGEWHHALFKAAADCKEQNYSQEETEHLLAKATGTLDDHDINTITDVYLNRPSKYAPREVRDFIDASEWPNLGKDKEGPSGQSPDNYLFLFEKWKLNFALNEIDNSIYLNGKHWSDEDRLSLWIRCKRVGMHGSQDLMFATITKLAQSNSFNPMKQVIEAAPWDGKDHLGALFETLGFDEDRLPNVEIYRKYLTKWTVGIVSKIYNPGSQNLVFTFVGTQGIGKSRWLSKFALWPTGYGEGAVDPNNKDHELRHLTHVIWHIPELDYTTGRRETGALKDYLTRDAVSVRPAYARVVRHGRSICSFAASCNTTDFLVDQTGNRRFLIVPVKSLDHNHKVPMQQVFAQARALLEQGYQFWLDDAEIAELNALNEEFALEDAIVAAANKVEPGAHEMTLLEIMDAFSIKNPTRADISRFGAALGKRGFKKRRRVIDGKFSRFYCIKHPNRVSVPTIQRGDVVPLKRPDDSGKPQ